MKIVNVHQRLLQANSTRVAELIATLGSANDELWPRTGWVPMVLDRPLGVGASGGHGPSRYHVEAYEPDSFVRFRFRRLDGWHAFIIRDATPEHCLLEHRMEINAHGRALLLWLFIVRPLHDACLEDLLSQAQASLGEAPRVVRWSFYARLMRRFSPFRDGASGRRRAA